MLRPFTLRSKPISYAGGKAPVEWAKKARCRAAVIAVGALDADPAYRHFNLLTGLNIGGDQHVQGEAFPLSLLMPAPMAATLEPACYAPNFPGSLLPFRGGTVGGLLLFPKAEITANLEDLTTSTKPIERLVLHCLEFPEDAGAYQGVVDALWEKFSRGLGRVSFYGHKRAWTAAFAATFSAAPQAKGELRRHAVRGLCQTNDDFALAEADFRELTASLYTEEGKRPHDDPPPAREVIGIPGWERHNGLTDLQLHEKALIDLEASGAPTEASTIRLLSLFEGRDPAEPFVGTAQNV